MGEALGRVLPRPAPARVGASGAPPRIAKDLPQRPPVDVREEEPHLPLAGMVQRHLGRRLGAPHVDTDVGVRVGIVLAERPRLRWVGRGVDDGAVLLPSEELDSVPLQDGRGVLRRGGSHDPSCLILMNIEKIMGVLCLRAIARLLHACVYVASLYLLLALLCINLFLFNTQSNPKKLYVTTI